MKKSKKINSPKKLLQQQYKRILIVLIVFFVLVSLPLLFMGWAMGSFNFSAYQAEQNNPAKKLAEIMPPFAEEYNLEKIQEYNGAVFMDNATPWFLYIYQGNQSKEDLKEQVEQYLTLQGYRMNFSYNIDKRESNSSWGFEGFNHRKDKVSGTISTDLYYNYANNAGEKFGENRVPSGKVVLVIDFTSQR